MGYCVSHLLVSTGCQINYWQNKRKAMLRHRNYCDGLVLLENSPKNLRGISSSSGFRSIVWVQLKVIEMTAFGINQTWKLSKAQYGNGLRTLRWKNVARKVCTHKDLLIRLTIDQLFCCYQGKPRCHAKKSTFWNSQRQIGSPSSQDSLLYKRFL